MWLDRETGAKCYMLSARALCIIWGNTPEYWGWIPLTDSSFSEAARLLQVWWLEIRGKIDSKMLSQNSTYAAYIVFKTSVHLGESKSTCHVCLDVDDRDEDGEIPQNVVLPRERADGWMELEMGEFRNDEGEYGEVSIRLLETSAIVKGGLIVQGIEARPKKQRALSL
uniref:F-box domain-containing protein n=1 Tax=Setaria italica TaxID=4555 RepID=K3YXP6_SETIT